MADSVLGELNEIFSGDGNLGAFICGLMLYESDPELSRRISLLFQQVDEKMAANSDQFAALLRDLPLVAADG